MNTPLTARAILALSLSLLVACQGQNSATPAAQATSEPSLEGEAAKAFVIKRGINLNGWFQYGEFRESRFPELQKLRDLGIDFIRLPIEPTKFYDASSVVWAQLERTLTEAKRLGIRVIVDMHPLYSTQRLALTGAGDPRYPALLTKLATMLPKYGLSNVALELMNEPFNPVGDNACDPSFDWNLWQQKFYAAARAGSKTLTLISTGACMGGVEGLVKVKPLVDKNVIYSVHNYSPYQFTHQGATFAEWGLGVTRNVPYPSSPEGIAAILPAILYNTPNAELRNRVRGQLEELGNARFDRNSLQKELGQAAEWGKKNNSRIFLGEFGVFETVAPPQDRVRWIRDVREIAESLGMSHAMWGYDPEGTFTLHRDGALEAGVIEALGLKVTADAKPTPPNPVNTRIYPTNPVTFSSELLADFEAGSASQFGVPTRLYGYGKPVGPVVAAGTVPLAPASSKLSARLEFPYDIPPNIEYGGVVASVGLKSGAGIDTTVYTHLMLDMAVTGGSDLGIALEKDGMDNDGDNPQFILPANEKLQSYSIPLDAFKQAGWGKKIDIGPILRGLDRVMFSVTGVGQKGTVTLDNLRLVRMDESSSATPLTESQKVVAQDYELEGDAANSGGQSYLYGYQELESNKVIFSGQKVANGTGKALKVNFKIPTPNAYAAAMAVTALKPNNDPIDSSLFSGIRIDLAATGVTSLRVAVTTADMDTGGDNPYIRVSIDPTLKSYRLPFENFAQDGWGKAVDLKEFMSKINAVNVYADTVGSEGTMTLDNLVLEKK